MIIGVRVTRNINLTTREVEKTEYCSVCAPTTQPPPPQKKKNGFLILDLDFQISD